ncbi:NADH-cytochrome b5 reductase [Irineochytrium annulatum]|nr:NADH-cytochrome b5 reductase [Irineochytrium annulatum]
MYKEKEHKDKLLIMQKRYKSNPTAALDPKEFQPFTLKEVIPINHNTSTFRFRLPEEATELGLPTASCIVTKIVDGVKSDGKKNVVIRPYTPVEDPAKGYTGTFDLIIKKYKDGPMSTHIHSMKPGDKLDMKGPVPKFPYTANKEGHIGMIAGGSGITPMLQVIQRIFANPEDKTRVSLVFANVTEEDILLKSYFDDLEKKHPEQFRVFYSLDKPPANWNGFSGFVNDDLLKRALPKPGTGKVFVCGPGGMMNHISGPKAPDYSQGELAGLLKKLGYKKDDVFKF